MIVYAIAVLAITAFSKFLWPITTGTSILTIFLLGMPLFGKTWLCNCICGGGKYGDDATGDVEMPKEGRGSSTSVNTEDYDLPTINKVDSPTSVNGASAGTDTTTNKTNPTATATSAGDWQTPSWLRLT